MHKLGVIVPYRNRTEHLNTFVERMTAHQTMINMYAYQIVTNSFQK